MCGRQTRLTCQMFQESNKNPQNVSLVGYTFVIREGLSVGDAAAAATAVASPPSSCNLDKRQRKLLFFVFV